MKILHLVCSCMTKIKANYVHRKELAKPTQEDELKVCFGAVRLKLDFSKRKTAKILLLNVKLSSVLGSGEIQLPNGKPSCEETLA